MKILVCGDAILDRYVTGKINRMSPEDLSIPILDVQSEEYRLGGCLNAAANIKSLSRSELEVHVSSVFSLFTKSLLKDRGITGAASLSLSTTKREEFTKSEYEIIKTRLINVETNKQMMRVDNRLKYHDLDIDSYHSRFEIEQFKEFDAIVVSDYNKGLINKSVIQELEKFKGPVFVDTKKPDLLIWNGIKKCILKINDKELRTSKNWTKLPQIIVTRGEKGAELLHYGEVQEIFHTKSVKNPEVTGAGDVFLSGLVVDYLKNQDLHSAIKFANMCANLSVKQQGTTEVRI